MKEIDKEGETMVGKRLCLSLLILVLPLLKENCPMGKKKGKTGIWLAQGTQEKKKRTPR